MLVCPAAPIEPETYNKFARMTDRKAISNRLEAEFYALYLQAIAYDNVAYVPPDLFAVRKWRRHKHHDAKYANDAAPKQAVGVDLTSYIHIHCINKHSFNR